MTGNNVDNCDMCKRPLNVESDPFSEDCGGTCVKCMADAGDPECEEHVAIWSEINYILGLLNGPTKEAMTMVVSTEVANKHTPADILGTLKFALTTKRPDRP